MSSQPGGVVDTINKFFETRFPPPMVMMFFGAVMWCLNRWLPVATLVEKPWDRVGLLSVAAGVAILVVAFREFAKAKTTINPVEPSQASSLVTHGIFSVSRNPMYVGFTLILVGWAILLGAITPLPVPLIFAAYISRFQIEPEERALILKFGETYLKYSRSTPRWLFSF
jgi:protein-S-isoprenylcysteine O-methyltransferase Ste14